MAIYEYPHDCADNWLPDGYELVLNSSHILQPTDAVLPRLSTDWRLVSTINNGERIGKPANDVDSDLMYIATLSLIG